jgi:hypothetical protein
LGRAPEIIGQIVGIELEVPPAGRVERFVAAVVTGLLFARAVVGAVVLDGYALFAVAQVRGVMLLKLSAPSRCAITYGCQKAAGAATRDSATGVGGRRM